MKTVTLSEALKFTPRRGRQHHIYYTESNNYLTRNKPGMLRSLFLVAKAAVKWWFK